LSCSFPLRLIAQSHNFIGDVNVVLCVKSSLALVAHNDKIG
jgi:hypothetical protein